MDHVSLLDNVYFHNLLTERIFGSFLYKQKYLLLHAENPVFLVCWIIVLVLQYGLIDQVSH